MQKVSKLRLTIYLSLTSIWFIVNMALIIYLTYLQDYGWFQGLAAVLLGLFSLVVGIPFFIFFIINLITQLKKYEANLKLNEKVTPIIAGIFPILTYIFIAYHVINNVYYLIFNHIIWLILLYSIFFIMLFRYSIAIVFNLFNKCVEMEKIFTVIFAIGFLLTVYIGTIPIYYESNIFDNRREILMQEHEASYQNSIFTYTYTKLYEVGFVEIEDIIQFLSYKPNSDEFTTNDISAYIYN